MCLYVKFLYLGVHKFGFVCTQQKKKQNTISLQVANGEGTVLPIQVRIHKYYISQYVQY